MFNFIFLIVFLFSFFEHVKLTLAIFCNPYVLNEPLSLTP